MVSTGLGMWQVLRAQSCQTRVGLCGAAMQGGGGLRRAAPCLTRGRRVGTGRGRVARGPGRGPGEAQPSRELHGTCL
eukprot:553493-Prymnesium_polylepis.1